MTRYYLEITCAYQGMDGTELEAQFEPLADALYELTDVIDADLGADFGNASLDFTMAVDADDPAEALKKGLTAVRCAVHAAGGSTPGWERHFETTRQVVSKESALV